MTVYIQIISNTSNGKPDKFIECVFWRKYVGSFILRPKIFY
jgi:hypothetical protein